MNIRIKTFLASGIVIIVSATIAISFQGCSNSQELQLVDGGINSPVAERAGQYLSGRNQSKSELDIFSYYTTPESLMELNIELEEEEVHKEYELRENKLPVTPSEEKIIDNEKAELPVKQALNSNDSPVGILDFYSGHSEIEAVSYDLSFEAAVDYNATTSNLSDKNNQIPSLDIDLDSIIGSDDLGDVQTNAEFRESQAGVSHVIQRVASEAAGEYIVVDEIECSIIDNQHIAAIDINAPYFALSNAGAGEFVEEDELDVPLSEGQLIVGIDINKPYFELSNDGVGEFLEEGELEVPAPERRLGIIDINELDISLPELEDFSKATILSYDSPAVSKKYSSAISGIVSTSMLEQAEKYDDVVLRMNESQVESQPELISQKYVSYQDDAKKKSIVKLTLAEAIRLSLGGNPDIRAASYVSKQVEERLNASKSVYDPTLYQTLSGESNEDLDADYYYQNLNPTMNTSGWSIESGIRQPLPTGGDISVAYEYAESRQDGVGKELFKGTGGPVVTLNHSLLRGLGDIDNKTAIKISKLNASMAQADFLAQSMDSMYEVCSAYWTLVFYLEQMAIQKRVLAMAKEVYEYEQTRNTTGIARKLNVERAFAAVEVRRSALMSMRDNVLTALDQLVLLIGNEEVFLQAELVLPTDRPLTSFTGFNERQAEGIALAMRPELMKEYSGIEIAEAKKVQADYNKLPTLELQAKYGLGGGNLGMNDNTLNNRYDKYGYDAGYWKVGLSFGYQIGSRGARAAYREFDALISENKARVEKTKREIKVEVRSAGRALTTAQKNMKITFRARKSALEVLEGERVRFKLGLTTNEELLRSQDYLAEREIAYFRSIIDCNVNALKLARAKGTILSDLGVDIAGIRKY